jgi:VWFA-related protein
MSAQRTKRALSAALSTALAFTPVAPAPILAAPQQPAPNQEVPLVIGVEAQAVVVDVVVRDKKGRLVRDLTAADFEVLEDGARQTVSSFRIVDNITVAEEEAAEAAAAAPATPATPATPAAKPAAAAVKPKPGGAPSVIAFVFDRLSTEARKTAHKASITYADRGYVAGDLVGVFSIDLALRTVQPFTNDVALVRTALDRAAAQANTSFASERDQARERQRAADIAGAQLGGMSAGTGGAAAAGQGAQAALLAEAQVANTMQANILRTFDALERDQQGFATTNGLLSVVNGLKAIPGRKTVVFFSEGLTIPANVQAQFRSVIASANRANVSVYAIDAGGLRIESGTLEAREEIVQSAQRRVTMQASGRDVSQGSLTRDLERNEDMLRLNPESGLGQLADETGGFLVRDTNDAGRGFGRIQEEMRFHYLLSYSPTNENMDGAFRTILIKVKRPGVAVQTRKGYFAVKPEYAVPVRGYEAPALAFLDKKPQPDAFPIRAAALSFPEGERPGLAPVLVEIPGTAVAWAPQKPTGFHAQFSVVARIKDAQGREADRLSQQYNLSTPDDKLETARAGNILFYREAEVPPGRYTAEVVAYDALAQSASVRTTTFEVPRAQDDPIRMSSLVVVGRMEKITPEEQKEGKNPLYYGETIVYPNMGMPLKKSTMPNLGFYFAVYGKNAATAKSATIELHQGDKMLGKIAAPLPAPDAKGRIQHAGALPLSAFSPGSYTLKVSVNDGPSVVSRAAAFTVVE